MENGFKIFGQPRAGKTGEQRGQLPPDFRIRMPHNWIEAASAGYNPIILAYLEERLKWTKDGAPLIRVIFLENLGIIT